MSVLAPSRDALLSATVQRGDAGQFRSQIHRPECRSQVSGSLESTMRVRRLMSVELEPQLLAAALCSGLGIDAYPRL